MTGYLRTVSTRRLLAIIAGLLVAAIGGTAIAVAAAGNGPVPPRKPLAAAIHSALKAKAPAGITARVTFTNHLINATALEGGSDPILSGASGRLWLSPSSHRLRLELQSDSGGGDAQLVVDNGSFWAYDPGSDTVYEGRLPKRAADAHKDSAGIPTITEIQRYLIRIMGHVDLSGAIPSDVAGHAAYTIKVTPKHSGGLLGAAELAWDAIKGVPLRIAVYARNDTTPVLELKATDISYGPVPASDFNVSPPKTAKVVRVKTPQGKNLTGPMSARDKHRRHVSGVQAVASKLPFKLDAPSSLVGLKRRAVTLLDWGGKPAAVVAYGQNLGGIAVIEQVADSGAKTHSNSGDHGGLSLPTVSINGITGQELDTALGTMVRFTRNGISYTVLGSVPAVAADQAARAL
jgi:outer membrane lipoprotein-sorting protein